MYYMHYMYNNTMKSLSVHCLVYTKFEIFYKIMKINVYQTFMNNYEVGIEII